MPMMLDGYYAGIAYATGYTALDKKQQYLVIRNLDDWYVKCFENISKYKAYQSLHKLERDRKPQWCIKARDINCIPQLAEVKSLNDFCRAYIEIHGILDMATSKNRKGEYFKKPRLRIYGSEEIMTFLNNNLPAMPKKIQYIKNNVDDKYIGQTCALYYQSSEEISAILRWIDGDLRNEKIWAKWNNLLCLNEKE